MRRTFLLLAAFTAPVAGGLALAQSPESASGKAMVKILSAVDAAEKFDGKKATATTVEVTLPPGASSAPHRHPGPVFGYVIEGTYEWAIDENPAKLLKAG